MSNSPNLFYSSNAGLRRINYTGRWKLKRTYQQSEPELFIEHAYDYDDSSYVWISEQEITEMWPIVGERQ